MQSFGYGETQALEGWSVERVRLPGGGLASVLLRGPGPFRWAYVPRGPVPATPAAIGELVAWAGERRLARLRVEPEAGGELEPELRRLGFVPAPAFQPQHTAIIALAPEPEMMAGFKSKHRYNIRLAGRHGITVDSGDDVAELARQSALTAARQGITLPRAEFYRNRQRLLPWCRVYVARHGGEPVYAIMVARFAGRAYYLFGGGTPSARHLMPAYAVQWAAIKEAYAEGCRDYDLWGLPPAADPGHPWFGLWQFKTGFGGAMTSYCGAWDMVFSPLAARLGGVSQLLRRGIGQILR